MLNSIVEYAIFVPIWWLLVELIGYVVHKLMHITFVTEHEEHHMVLYPPNDFCSDKYRTTTSASKWKQYLWYGIPPILVVGVICALGGAAHALIFALVGALSGFINSYWHDAMHINDHWLGTFVVTKRWYWRCRGYHFVHHVELHKNLGMYNYVWDRITGTKQRRLHTERAEDSPWKSRDDILRKGD